MQVSEKYFIDLKIEGGLNSLRLGQFQSLVVRESVGFTVPVFELALVQNSYELLPYLRNSKTKGKLTLGTSVEKSKQYDILILNYSYTENGDQLSLVLTGTFDISKLSDVPHIRCIEGTSDEVLSKIDSVDNLLVNYTGKDKQKWIQHGNSDLNFISRVVDHAYCEDEDCIIGAITIDNELIVKSLKTEFKGTPKISLSNDTPDSKSDFIKYEGTKVESDSALWSELLADNKKLPIISVIGRSPGQLGSNVVSIVDKQSNDDDSSNIYFPTIIDCGNCFDKYYQAYLNNLNCQVQFNRFNVYLIIGVNYISNERLKLLDLVKYTPIESKKTKMADPISGKYIVTEKVHSFSITGYVCRVKLNRDFTLHKE